MDIFSVEKVPVKSWSLQEWMRQWYSTSYGPSLYLVLLLAFLTICIRKKPWISRILIWLHLNPESQPTLTFPGPSNFWTFWLFAKFELRGKRVYRELHQFWMALARIYDDYGLFTFSPFLFGANKKPLVVVFKAEIAEAILKDVDLGQERAMGYRTLRYYIKDGLLICPWAKWKAHRKMLNPGFSYRMLQDYLQSMNKQSKILVKKVKEVASEEPTVLMPLVNRFSVDVISESTMGKNIGCQETIDSKFLKDTIFIQRAAAARMANPLVFSDLILEVLPIGRKIRRGIADVRSFIGKIFEERKQLMVDSLLLNVGRSEDILESRKGRLCFIDQLLKCHLVDRTFSKEQSLDEINGFIMAGQETTSGAIAWALYLIANHPEVQQKIFDELDAIFGSDKQRDVTSEDLQELTYLKCVVKETLRLYPPVGMVGRKVTKDNYYLNGHRSPPGTRFLISIWQIHRDPRYFPTPERFIPERFMANAYSEDSTSSYGYMPFGAGPRSCIGMKFAMNEAMTALAHVFRNFSMKCVDSMDNMRIRVEIVYKPVQSPRFIVTPRP